MEIYSFIVTHSGNVLQASNSETCRDPFMPNGLFRIRKLTVNLRLN